MMKKLLAAALLFVAFAGKSQFIVNDGIVLTNTADITTNGDWVNDGSFTNNGIIRLNDNWTNLGTYEAGTGKFVLNYAVDKTFDNNEQNIHSLIKMGNGNLILGTRIVVTDTLSLSAGLITGSLVDIGENAFVNVAANSWITSPVIRNGSGTLDFPVGTATSRFSVKLNGVTGSAPRVSVAIEPFPGGYSPGVGVDSLLSTFPIAWRITATPFTDTASYIQFGFPDNLNVNDNLSVVVRDAGGNTFEGMGKRALTNVAGYNFLTSYSKGLRGLFSLAAGFPGNLATDSLALVTFYNTTGSTAWTKDTNWLTGNVNTWQGIDETGGRITGITLNDANISGVMPAEIADILGLETVDVSGNGITSIPDFTELSLTTLDVSDNKLDFASLEYNAPLGAVITYAPQKVLGSATTLLAEANQDYLLTSSVGGTQNQYQWKRAGATVPNATSASYTIPSINRNNMGDYELEITNTLVSGLTLRTAPTTVLAVAELSGQLMMSGSQPASDGTMRLLRITPTGAYDTTQTVTVSNAGEYVFSQVVLDDYLMLGFADTLATGQDRALPTYYSSTLYWDEADTLEIEGSLDNLDIISQLKPTEPLVDNGVIAGIVEEDDGTSARGMATARVGGAGVSARRTQGTGRGEEVLELVAYVYTNDQGEFTISGLPPGQYRLNIQYPGFPMNEESDIDLTIGTSPLEEIVNVEATVAGGSITVRKLIVTGLFEEVAYKAEVFPNPTVEQINFEFEKVSSGRELILLDVAGKPVKSQAAPDKTGSMLVKELSVGTYLLQVKDQDKVQKIIRVVIE